MAYTTDSVRTLYEMTPGAKEEPGSREGKYIEGSGLGSEVIEGCGLGSALIKGSALGSKNSNTTDTFLADSSRPFQPNVILCVWPA